jgi:hypothetical protein
MVSIDKLRFSRDLVPLLLEGILFKLENAVKINHCIEREF